MWRLCRWLIGRNLFWNSIVNKPHINLVALALTIQRKMHLHGIKSSYKPCPFIHVNRIFYFEKIVFIDGGRTAEKDDDFISGKKIRYFDPWWPWWTSSNSPQEFSLKDFFAIRIKILWWWPEIVVNLNWTCKIFSRYRRCCCFFWGHYAKIWRRIVVDDVLYKSWSSFINGGKELFCTRINSKCQSTRDSCSQ